MVYVNSRFRREVSKYLKKLKDEGLSDRYLVHVRSTLLSFLNHCKGYGIQNPHAVTSDAVTSYLTKYENSSGGNQRQKACFLRRFLAYSKNPVMVSMRPKIHGTARTRVDWLTPTETEAILAMPMTATEAILVRAGLLQGMRRIESLRLTTQDAQNAMKAGILVVRGKGMKLREIPLHIGFAEALRAYFEKNPSLMGVSPLLGIQRSRSEKVLGQFCARFGRKFTFHTLRRTFGRNLWLRGVPLETISELLGHSSTDMTRLYIGINLVDMRRAIAELGCKSDLVLLDEQPQRRVAPSRPPELLEGFAGGCGE